MRIVVADGGQIGARLVSRLRGRGHEVMAPTPDTGVNIVTGAGVTEAVAGADVVIDVSNPPTTGDFAALEYFERSTRNLLAAEAEACVGHHVVLSAPGVERLRGSGYFRAKGTQEKMIEHSSLPYSIVQATQFFEYLPSMAAAAADDCIVRFAPVLFQPVAADDTIEVISAISAGSPVNGKVEVAGPEQFRMDEFFRSDLAERGDSRRVLTDPHASFFGAELDERTLLPGGGAVLGPTRYHEWSGRATRK